jgi:predicted MFS family arabinose efflux permease
VVQLLVDDTPREKHTSLFALFSLSFVIPLILLPSFVGWGVDRWGLVPTMRVMFALTAALTLTGILWRRVRLKESPSVNRGAGLAELLKEAAAVTRHFAQDPGIGPVLGCYLLSNVWTNLNGAYYGLYVTKELGLGDSWVGVLSTLSAVAFVTASLSWVPRLRHGKEDSLFFWTSLLYIPGTACLALCRSVWSVVALCLFTGFVSAVQGALMSERSAGLLPKDREGLGQSLLASAMQASVALGLALGGILFETQFWAFPYVIGALAAVQTALAWILWRRRQKGALQGSFA